MHDPIEPQEPPPSKPRPGIRWWPAWLIIIACAGVVFVFRFAGEVPFQTRNLRTAVTVVVSTLLLGVWWLLFSRAHWRSRLVGVLGGALLLGAVASLFRIRGVSGDLVPILEPRWASHEAAPVGPASPIVAPATTNGAVQSVDFPQFQGPRRDGVIEGIRLARDWKATAPQIVWKQPIGAAWSGFAVVGTRAVTQEQRGEEELVTCYELRTGRKLWEHADSSRYATTLAGEGPRCTPSVVGSRVYTLGANGLLNCLDWENGRRVWGRDLRQDAGVGVPGWGFASSPLVHEGRVIVSAGGRDNRSLLAYRADDGEIAWAAGTRPANYSSPALLNLLGVPQVVMFNSERITAHAHATGEVLWEYPWGIGQPHVALPVPVGTNRVVFSSGYGVGAELVELEIAADGRMAPRRVWKSIRLKSKFANFFHRDGYLYGLDDGILACVGAQDGGLRWKEGRYGHGQMLWVRDVLLIMAESGEIVMLAPTPEAPRELGRFRVLSGKTWNPPALAGEWLLVRNDLEAACVRLPVVH